MDNNLIINTQLEFIQEDDEAFASITRNPLFQMVKIVVCDDRPNANKQRVSEEEFGNLIGTGINSPIKMAEGKISEGHAEAFGKPIGTITQLIKENNVVKAIGALWKRERPEDIKALKEMYEKGDLPQVSWELAYTHSDIEEDGTESLKGVILNGVAIVKNPAYAGRTPIYAMAEKINESETIESPDNNLNLEGNSNVDELEQLKAELESLKDQLKVANETIATLTGERDSLAEYKNGIEAEKAKAEKLASIKEKFESAGVKKDESYFTDKAEMLLKLEDDELDYMIQEFVSFSQVTEKSESTSSTQIPNFSSKKSIVTDPKELAKALRDLKK